MAVASFDLSAESLSATTSIDAYEAWARMQGPYVEAALAALGFFDRRDDLASALALVNEHTAKIKSFIEREDWRSAVQRGTDSALLLIRPSHPAVRLYALVGPGRSNGSATHIAGQGIVSIWLESWLGASATRGKLQDCELRTLPAAVAHELAHAFRYALPQSRDPIAIANVTNVAEIWPARTNTPLRDTMYDEGLAVLFSIDAAHELSVADALSMNELQLEWLERNWRALVAERESRDVLDVPRPSFESIADALFLDLQRTRGPFSISRPPAKWGYYVGLQWAREATGGWLKRLTSPAPRRRP